MKIVAAAVFFEGVTFSIEAPARHFQIMQKMTQMGVPLDGHHEQGFLTDEGFFVRRKPALIIAEKAGQLVGRTKTSPTDQLFSEDLW